ncbi:MAG: 23S rRNA (adenine(2503)-C(2))-methyltransferase RlmN [Bdellovibrionales bacterium]
MEKVNFFDQTQATLREHFQACGEKPFRADQLFSWIYRKREESVEAMTDLSKGFRESIDQRLYFERPEVVEFRQSKDGTQKFLFDVGDGLTVETVMIPSGDRKTLCVSSEVGCNLACKFCFTGKYKLKKRLSPGQIVGQFLEVNDRLLKNGEKGLSNVVFMGMGEPLDNLEGVFGAIEILQNDKGINFSRKRVTVSTSGLVNFIPLISKSGAHLAVSLNGSNDEVRSSIMPINKKHPIRELLQATDKHSEETGSEVTFEYVLLKGVTDEMAHARELAVLLKGRKAMVNLIPFNEHPDSGFEKPDHEQVDKFQNYLVKKGIRAYKRQTRGEDIFAACGQLHAIKQEELIV